MWNHCFYQDSTLHGLPLPQSPHSRHGILLASYTARRHERLALERIAARAASRSFRRKFAALPAKLGTAMVEHLRRLMPARYGISKSDTERASGLVAGE